MQKHLTYLISLSILLICNNASAQSPSWSWAHAWAGTSYDEGNCIATDPSGNVYVGGEFFSSIVTMLTTEDTLQNTGNRYDCFIIKYSPTGSVIWTRTFGHPSGDETINGIAADAAGNVYVHGSSTAPTLIMDEDTLSNSGAIVGAFTAKLNVSGTVQWARSSGVVGTTGTVTATSVAIDQNGNVIAAGNTTCTSFSFGTDAYTLHGTASSDIYVVKYDANGNYLWSHQYGNMDADLVGCITTDPFNNIWLSGYFNSTTINFGTYTFSKTVTNPNPIYITKLDPSGNVTWASSGLGNAVGLAIAPDPFGNLYLTGTFTVDMVLGGTTLTSAGSHDFYIAKFNNDGVLIWLKSNGSAGFEKTVGITTDNSGKFYITGFYSNSTLTFGDSTISNTTGPNDLFVAKYDTAGNGIWAMTAKAGPSNDPPSGIATDKSGNNIYITGYTTSNTLQFGAISMLAPYASTGQDAFVACINLPVTGIENGSKEIHSKIYPNPTADLLTVEASGMKEVVIIDINGKEVFSGKCNSNPLTINASSFSPGIYIVKAITGKGIIFQKFMKQ